MSLYVLMRLLESAPRRYELGTRLLTLGRLEHVYDRLVTRVRAGERVIDLGCGTGLLMIRAARRGARVKGIDINPQMLEIARQRAQQADLEGQITIVEMGVAELDMEETGRYDVVTSGLLFSELDQAELHFALEQINRILRCDGLLLVADEVRPATPVGRILHGLIRFPLATLTYILTQHLPSHPIVDLPRLLEGAGFVIEVLRRHRPGSLMEIVARKARDSHQ